MAPRENNLEFNRVRCTCWMLGSKPQLSIESKLLLYKVILKPIWTYYGVQLWGAAPNSNIQIIQRFQNKYLRIIVNAPCYVTNDTLYHDLNVPYVKDEIKKLSQRYIDRLVEHPNILAIDLMSDAETHIEEKTTSRFVYLIIL